MNNNSNSSTNGGRCSLTKNGGKAGNAFPPVIVAEVAGDNNNILTARK